MRKLILLVLMASAAFAQTAINDTLYLQSAAPWTGQITVSWPAFTSCAGTAIARGSRTYAVNAGVVSITLYATDCASPSIAYAAAYRTMGGADHGKAWSETWAIPSSPSIVTLATVRQSSTLTARPLAHASTHASAGSDPVTLTEAQVTGLVSDLGAKASLANPSFTGNVTIGAPLPAGSGTSISPTTGVTSGPSVDVYDDFRGTAGAALAGRMPVVGSDAWIATGDGVAAAVAGAGTMGSSAANTYYLIQSSGTPWEVLAAFSDTANAPSAVISVVKAYPGSTPAPFGPMWHVGYGTSIGTLKWNDTWNGAATSQSGVAVAYSSYNSATPPCPTLSANTTYMARLTINPPYSDATIETPSGTVLCSVRNYDPSLSTLIGPYVYVQTTSATARYHSIRITSSKPTQPNSFYGHFPSGLDGTPIGQAQPAPGAFSSLQVGSGTGATPSGQFSVVWTGNTGDTPRIDSATGDGRFIVGTRGSGTRSSIGVQSFLGSGFEFNMMSDGSGVARLAMAGTDFVIKPYNAPATFTGNLISPLTTPANSAAACTAGAIWADASYVYVCTASGAIKRAAIASW